MKSRIGIIGVGLMGAGIGQNLVTKGWPLSYLRHPGNQPTTALDQAGAVGVDTAAELAQDCDVLLLCVTGTPQVEDVLTGSGQVLQVMRPGTIVIDCSTAIPASTIELARQVEAAGGRFVDAAMTRTPKEAAEGRLNLLIGGDDATVAEIMPVLEAFSENRFHAGPVGSGHRLKLLHNYVSLGTITLLSEAAACADKAGIPMDVLVDCLQRGGGHGAALDRISPYLLEGSVDKLRFTISNSLKDLTYYNAMADEVAAASRVSQAVRGTLADLVDDDLGDRMLPELPTLLGGR